MLVNSLNIVEPNPLQQCRTHSLFIKFKKNTVLLESIYIASRANAGIYSAKLQFLVGEDPGLVFANWRY